MTNYSIDMENINILWFQDPENDSQDVISFNGEIISPPSNPKYAEKYDILYDLDNESKSKSDKRKIPMYKLHNGYFIKGHFNEKDVLGRNVPFMFYANTTDKQDFLKRLQNEAAISEKTCPELLINDILNFEEKSLSLKTIMIGCFIAVLIISIIVLISSNK